MGLENLRCRNGGVIATDLISWDSPNSRPNNFKKKEGNIIKSLGFDICFSLEEEEPLPQSTTLIDQLTTADFAKHKLHVDVVEKADVLEFVMLVDPILIEKISIHMES